MKDINKMSWKEIKSEALKAHKIVRDSDKRQGIIGYRLMTKDDKRYLTFNGKVSLETMCFCDNLEEAYVFKDRIELLPFIMKIDPIPTLLPITKTAF